MGMRVRIAGCVVEIIQRAAAAAAPREACGLLFGSEGEITGWQAAENVAENPERHFEIDPRTPFAALRAERAGGAKIIGYWHSQPSGDARPRVAEAAAADPDGRLWLIVTRDEATLWRAGNEGLHGRFLPVELTS